MKRLVVELDDDLHKQMRKKAFLSELCIKQYIEQLLKRDLKEQINEKKE